MRIIICLFLAAILTGCHNKRKQTIEEKKREIQTGLLQSNGSYTVKEIGWTVQLPTGWDIIKKDELKRMQARGKKEMEKTFDTEIDDSGVEPLISIRKDKINSFISNMQKVDSIGNNPTYDERIKIVFDAIRETYRTKGIKMEHAVGAIRIGGLMFDRLEMKIFVKDKKDPAFYQDLYITSINDYDFTMAATYDNDEDMQILWNVLHSSLFSSKK